MEIIAILIIIFHIHNVFVIIVIFALRSFKIVTNSCSAECLGAITAAIAESHPTAATVLGDDVLRSILGGQINATGRLRRSSSRTPTTTWYFGGFRHFETHVLGVSRELRAAAPLWRLWYWRTIGRHAETAEMKTRLQFGETQSKPIILPLGGTQLESE
ncbi:hypothetical protein C8J57DRAFT_1212166 [Mycena rebaudengoi]|nr:hypothetical protein C8J57DRAFT_1212166 [Mycena rebaudengoi]